MNPLVIYISSTYNMKAGIPVSCVFIKPRHWCWSRECFYRYYQIKVYMWYQIKMLCKFCFDLVALLNEIIACESFHAVYGKSCVSLSHAANNRSYMFIINIWGIEYLSHSWHQHLKYCSSRHMNLYSINVQDIIVSAFFTVAL